jgi:acetyl esterase
VSKALELVPPKLQVAVEAGVLRAALQIPRPLMRGLAGKPIVRDGQQLALEAQLLLRLQRLSGQTGMSAGTVELARSLMRRGIAAVEHARLSGVEITKTSVPTDHGSVPARLYRPESLTGPSSLLVYYHGGGWVIGDLDSHDDLCRFLAENAGVRVLSVDYRLAPEHPFPAAVDDSIDAFRHVAQHAADFGTSAETIAVGGDSAGGNLAAVVAQHVTRSELPNPAFQLLLYPAVDATVRRPSREMFANGFLLTDNDIDWFIDRYQPDVAGRGDHRLSPLLAEDLTGLPPAYVVTAGFDPLRDEGEDYARGLEKAGVRVVARRFPDLIHGFASLRQVGGRFQEALFEVAATLRAGLSLGTDT